MQRPTVGVDDSYRPSSHATQIPRLMMPLTKKMIVWWNMYVLHSKQRKHPYLDGLRTSRNDLLRRELRNGIAPGEVSYQCPFCGFMTPFLVQHWLTHNKKPASTARLRCTAHRTPSPDCRQCIESRYSTGCKHPGVKYGARLVWAAIIRCSSTLIPDPADPLRVTIANAYKASSNGLVLVGSLKTQSRVYRCG